MSSRTLRLLLVRHGVTAWNREMRMQGHTDIPLDEEGLRQAERLAARVASLAAPPVAIYSSDLTRARQTAEAVANRLGLEVRTTALLRETMLGEWEGLNREEIRGRGDAEHLVRYLFDPHQHRPPGSETLEAAWERMHTAIDGVRADWPQGGTVCVVGHGGSLRALICSALDAPITSMRRLFLDNTSLSILEEVPGPAGMLRRVALVNDTSHLREPVNV